MEVEKKHGKWNEAGGVRFNSWRLCNVAELCKDDRFETVSLAMISAPDDHFVPSSHDIVIQVLHVFMVYSTFRIVR